MYNFTVYIIFSCRYEQAIKKIHVASQVPKESGMKKKGKNP
jgi:hypothetical protein